MNLFLNQKSETEQNHKYEYTLLTNWVEFHLHLFIKEQQIMQLTAILEAPVSHSDLLC